MDWSLRIAYVSIRIIRILWKRIVRIGLDHWGVSWIPIRLEIFRNMSLKLTCFSNFCYLLHKLGMLKFLHFLVLHMLSKAKKFCIEIIFIRKSINSTFCCYRSLWQVSIKWIFYIPCMGILDRLLNIFPSFFIIFAQERFITLHVVSKKWRGT